MPPRLMFRTAQRPKGLEFPSCRACNRETSRLDVVAAFMARTYPPIENKRDEVEWGRLIEEVKRVAPGLLEEMLIPPAMQEPMLSAFGLHDFSTHAVFRANGPLLSAHMQAFAAKVGFALHYEFIGRVVPESGRIQVRWFTNEETINKKVPESLYFSIGTPSFLRQGKVTSKQIFEYGFGYYKERSDVKLFYARLRQAIEIAAFVVDDPIDMPFVEGDLATFALGDLQLPPVDRIKD